MAELLQAYFDASAPCYNFLLIAKSKFPSSKGFVSSDSTLPREAAPISDHFSQEAVKSLFVRNLTPKAYCCHMANNTSCK